MLVWLASYPRSGNTLLRQVLKTCFDLDSCEGLELIPEHLRDPDGVRYQHYGTYYVDDNWEEFYQKSRQSSELVLVKTHQLPRDDEKAIYVVRDGRLAIKSFVKFQDNYHPGRSTFTSLLLGDHPYGEWSSHYDAWCRRPAGQLLLLRFEELVEPSAELLARVAQFIGVPGPARPWVSHLDELRERHPAYFGSGDRGWKRDAFWTEGRMRNFYTLHGNLLVKLGYAPAAEAEAGAWPAGSDEEQLVRTAHASVARRDALQLSCDERQEKLVEVTASCNKHLKGLLAEVDGLAAVCKEREEEIQRREDHRLAASREIDELQSDRQALHRRIREMEGELKALQRRTVRGLLSRLIRI